jgi:putative toxin-antitoxin system antitoxin component (TIGR02293 family)
MAGEAQEPAPRAATPEVKRFRALVERGEAAQNRHVALVGLRTYDTGRLVRRVEAGLSFRAFERLQAGLDLSARRLAELVDISPRTLARRREREHLDAAESDRLLRAARLFGAAIELFEGDDAAAREWLRTPQPGLGGAVPLELAHTEIGAREVERLVGRLEHGILS